MLVSAPKTMLPATGPGSIRLGIAPGQAVDVNYGAFALSDPKFALLKLFDDFTFIVKRELMWIPIFGWCMWKGRMIPVDRGAGSQALTDMTARAKASVVAS